MIGTFVRGFHHLKKIVDRDKRVTIICALNGGQIMKCACTEAFFDDSPKKEYALINQYLGDRRYNSLTQETSTVISEIMWNTNCGDRIVFLNSFWREFRHHLSWMIVLPTEFDAKYNKMLSNNKKLKELTARLVGDKSPISMLFFCLFGNTPTIYQWALSMYAEHSIHYSFFFRINSFLENYGQVCKNLQRNNVTAYNTSSKITELISEISELTRGKRANDAINTFNTKQKKLLKSVPLEESELKLLSRFQFLSQEKRRNFVRKMSTIEEKDEIIRQMTLVTKTSFKWNRDSLIDFVKNSDGLVCDIVYDKDNVVIVETDNYESIKYLAKTTNWCISKNKQYWNNYMNDRRNKQFVLYDFNQDEDSELSIIGFTVSVGDGITAAHSFTNNNLMRKERTTTNRLSSFITASTDKGIFGILAMYQISLDDIVETPKMNRKYEWNASSFINYINRLIGDDNYDLIKYNEDCVAFMTCSSKVCELLISKQNEVGMLFCRGVKAFVIADFTYEESNPKRIQLCQISKNTKEYLERPLTLYLCNAHESPYTFDEVIAEQDIPFDVICRPNDAIEHLKSDFYSYNAKGVKESLKEKKVVDYLKKKEDGILEQIIFNAVKQSIFEYNSFDLIDALYDNGVNLNDILDCSFVYDIISSCIWQMESSYQHIGSRWCPSATNINEFNTARGRHLSYEKRMFTAMAVLFKRFIENEIKQDNDVLINIFGFYYSELSNAVACYVIKLFENEVNLELVVDVSDIDSYLNIVTSNEDLFKNHLIKYGHNAKILDWMLSCARTHEQTSQIMSLKEALVKS